MTFPKSALSMNTGKWRLRKPSIFFMKTPENIGATQEGSVSMSGKAPIGANRIRRA